MTEKRKAKILPVRMHSNQYYSFKTIADSRKETRSALIRQWIDEYITNHNKGGLTRMNYQECTHCGKYSDDGGLKEDKFICHDCLEKKIY
jgi:hypothetical protein